jgi:NAD(P)-dependent dehydrogenase (short-subunit alcohol dehydrogenase family)
MNNLTQKTIIITGANSGIGKSAAIQLARLGANIIIACRSAERGAKALEEIKTASNSQKVELLQVDMSRMSSIRNFVREFLKTTEGWMCSSIMPPILTTLCVNRH